MKKVKMIPIKHCFKDKHKINDKINIDLVSEDNELITTSPVETNFIDKSN